MNQTHALWWLHGTVVFLTINFNWFLQLPSFIINIQVVICIMNYKQMIIIWHHPSNICIALIILRTLSGIKFFDVSDSTITCKRLTTDRGQLLVILYINLTLPHQTHSVYLTFYLPVRPGEVHLPPQLWYWLTHLLLWSLYKWPYP